VRTKASGLASLWSSSLPLKVGICSPYPPMAPLKTRSSAELTSQDHAPTSTFLHIHRIFQGPDLPPSNTVLPHPVYGEPSLLAHHCARRGLTVRPSSFVSLSHLPPLHLSISETVSPEYDTRTATLLASPGRTRTGLLLISVPSTCSSAILAALMPLGTRGVVSISTRGPHRRALLSVKVARPGYRAVSLEAC
jgi:hypothetical protein